jgi:hypothetical protein
MGKRVTDASAAQAMSVDDPFDGSILRAQAGNPATTAQ